MMKESGPGWPFGSNTMSDIAHGLGDVHERRPGGQRFGLRGGLGGRIDAHRPGGEPDPGVGDGEPRQVDFGAVLVHDEDDLIGGVERRLHVEQAAGPGGTSGRVGGVDEGDTTECEEDEELFHAGEVGQDEGSLAV